MQATVYIGLGANLGDGINALCQAWQRLGEIGGIEIKDISHPFSTMPVDMESASRFINAAGSLATTLGPAELLRELLQVEAEWGRVRRGAGHEDRPLDLDILFYDRLVCEKKGLCLPHPRCADRLFVLEPLVEIAPELIHPVLNQTVSRLRDALLATAAGRAEQLAMRRLEWLPGWRE